MTLHAAPRSLRYDATVRPGNPDGRCAPLRRKLLCGCPRGARSQPSRGPRRSERLGWLSAPLTSIGGRRSPLQARHRLRRPRPWRRLSRPQVARAGNGTAVQPLSFGVKGLPPKNGA